MFALKVPTPTQWVDTVMEDMDAFLVDHAACERKASATGMSFVVRYPDRPALVEAMIEFAREELDHFQRVYQFLSAKNIPLGPDTKDYYVANLLTWVRTGRDPRLLDRLLVAGVVEARGCERFSLLANALPPGNLKDFYLEITRAESRHHALFLRLARNYFPEAAIEDRLASLLDREAEIISQLPISCALH